MTEFEPYSDIYEAALNREWEHEREHARDFMQWMWPRTCSRPDGCMIEAITHIMVAFAKQEISRRAVEQ